MRAIQAQVRRADQPISILVVSCQPVLGFVIQGDGILDNLGNRTFMLLSFNPKRIEGFLWDTNGEGGIFCIHKLSGCRGLEPRCRPVTRFA